MTRILALTNWYPPHHFGGYEVMCFDVMTRLAARGHDVRVLCSQETVAGASAPEPESEQRVHRDLRLYMTAGEIIRPPVRERLAIERHNHAMLARRLAEHRPEVVSVWHMGAMSMGLLTHIARADIPMVYVVGDDWPAYAERLDAWSDLFARGPLRRAAGRVVELTTHTPTVVGDLGASGAFCFISESTRQSATSLGRWYLPNAGVVYPGVDLTLFPPDAARPRPASGWRLLYAGRLDGRKGVDALLRALTLLPPEATLECDGRGDEAEQRRLAVLTEDLGLADRVRFTASARDDLPRIYGAADIVVFPSEWNEPFGMVPLEAMACATPVVATGTGGSGEFLRHEYNSLLFPPGDHAALAAAVRRIHDEDGLRARIIAGGLHTVRELDATFTADGLEAWHRAAAAGFPHGLPSDRRPDLPETGTAPDGHPEPAPAVHGDPRWGTPALHLGADDRQLVETPTGSRLVRARADQLPFVSGTFTHVTCEHTLETLPDDAAGVQEVARVMTRGGSATVLAANATDASVLRAKVLDRARGWRKPVAAYREPGHLRQYRERQLQLLLRQSLDVRSHAVRTWGDGGRARALANALVRRGPLRILAPTIVLEAERP